MKIVTDLSVTSRPLSVGAGFSPRNLFATGTSGFYWSAAQLAAVFADSAAATPALLGQSVARVNDQSPNGLDTVQASAGLRPLLGRVPVAGRRNMLQYTEALDNAWWEKIGTTISDLGNGEFELTANAGEGSKRLQASEPTFPDDPEDACWSVEVQYVNWPRVTLLGVGGSPSSGNQSGATFNLETGEVVYESSGVVTTMTLLPDGWYRISMQGGDNDFRRRRRLIMLDGNFAFASGNQNWTADGTEKVRVRRPQFERAEAPTPYQRVGNALDVTEDGFPSPAFIRFDLSDDVLPTAFPDGGTFDVMLFGRQGSWIERGVTIAPAGSLDIGPTTITDGPAGLLAALGDIVGWTAVDRTLSGAEVSRLVKYHKARGAGDLLESIE